MAKHNKAEQRARNDAHAAYKEMQRQGYQRDDDPCKNLKNRIDFLDRMIAARTQYDIDFPHRDYPNGRHAEPIAKDTADRDRLKKQYDEQCKQKCDADDNGSPNIFGTSN